MNIARKQWVFRAIGIVLLLNYGLSVWSKYLDGEKPTSLLYLCSLLLLIAGLGFLTTNTAVIKIAFIGTFYMMLLWIIDMGGYLLTGHFILGGITKFVLFSGWLQRLATLYHLYLPLICLVGILGESPTKGLWKTTTVIVMSILLLSLIWGPEENINFVYALKGIRPGILVQIAALPLVFYLSERLLSAMQRAHRSKGKTES